MLVSDDRDSRNWKAVKSDWEFIDAQPTDGTIACLSLQQRQLLLSFVQVAYWPTRWTGNPDKDELEALVSKIQGALMHECELTIEQDECSIRLLLNGEVISSFELDAKVCDDLKGETGAPGPDGADGEDGRDGGGYPETEPPELTGTEDEIKTQIFSGCMNVINWLEEKIQEFYQAAGAAASAAHAVMEWIDAFPIIETLNPVDNMIEAADEWLEYGLLTFEANSTEELRQEMACELFCIIVQNDYSFDEYVWSLAILLWATKLIGLNAARPHYFTAVVFWPYQAIANQYILGLNDGDEDWMILCECAGGACGMLTFDSEDDVAYTVQYGSLQQVGNPLAGLEAEFYSSPPTYPDGRQLECLLELPEDKTLSAVSFDWNYALVTGGGDCGRQVVYYDSSMVEIDSWSSTVARSYNDWHNVVASLSGAGVRYVKVRLSYVCDEDDALHIYLDNILLHCG